MCKTLNASDISMVSQRIDAQPPTSRDRSFDRSKIGSQDSMSRTGRTIVVELADRKKPAENVNKSVDSLADKSAEKSQDKINTSQNRDWKESVVEESKLSRFS
jgi:hypothetical protein